MYLHKHTEIFNTCDVNFELVSTLILNSLYILQIHQIPLIAAAIQIFLPVTLQTWHKKLDHPRYLNLKCFGHARNIDIKKMKVDKNVFLYKIYIKAKRKHWPLYKIQQFLKNIREKLYVDLMSPITLTR